MAGEIVVWVREGVWEAAIDAAAQLSLDRPVVLLHVLQNESAAAVTASMSGLLGRHHRPPPELAELATGADRALLNDAAARLGRPAHRETRSGRMEREVVAAAEGAALLVVSRDGDRHRLGPHSLGPATRFVVDHAPCAVLLVWPGEVPGLRSIPPPPPHRG